MMEILVALGDIYGAEKLVPVRSVQIAGVSYKNIGEAGLEWISDLKGHVVVPSILNPAGMDMCRWQEMGIEEEFGARTNHESWPSALAAALVGKTALYYIMFIRFERRVKANGNYGRSPGEGSRVCAA
jgi:predicted aconitase